MIPACSVGETSRLLTASRRKSSVYLFLRQFCTQLIFRILTNPSRSVRNGQSQVRTTLLLADSLIQCLTYTCIIQSSKSFLHRVIVKSVKDQMFLHNVTAMHPLDCLICSLDFLKLSLHHWVPVYNHLQIYLLTCLLTQSLVSAFVHAFPPLFHVGEHMRDNFSIWGHERLAEIPSDPKVLLYSSTVSILIITILLIDNQVDVKDKEIERKKLTDRIKAYTDKWFFVQEYSNLPTRQNHSYIHNDDQCYDVDMNECICKYGEAFLCIPLSFLNGLCN